MQIWSCYQSARTTRKVTEGNPSWNGGVLCLLGDCEGRERSHKTDDARLFLFPSTREPPPELIVMYLLASPFPSRYGRHGGVAARVVPRQVRAIWAGAEYMEGVWW